MKMPFRHQYMKQLISTAVIWLAFQAVYLTQILKNLSTLGNFSSLITASFFVALYQGMNWLYDKWLWKLFHLKYAIDGQWVYALHSLASGRTPFGTFEITQDANKIEVSNGMVWYAPNEPRGTWEGEVIYWNANYIMLLFRMRSLNMTRDGSEFGEISEGIFMMNYQDTPIKYMTGAFNDLGLRSSKKGSVIMKKISAKEKDKINQIGMELAKKVYSDSSSKQKDNNK